MKQNSGQIQSGQRLSPLTEFKKGVTPWNTGIKGIHLNPETEFKPGQIPHNKKWESDTCIIEGCGKKRPSGNRGMCNSHYMRWWRTGDAEVPLKKLINRPAIERFWFMVTKTEDCWNWKGKLDERGYGRFCDETGWSDMAHRWSYKHFKKEDPGESLVHHTCFNPKCVNPDHLILLKTHRENIIDHGSTNAAFLNSQKTHCKYGHEFTPENTYLGKNKYGPMRVCKTCQARRTKEYLARKNQSTLIH